MSKDSLSEQKDEAVMARQTVQLEAKMNPVVLAELSEKARTAGNSSKADHLLLLAWAAYDEAEGL